MSSFPQSFAFPSTITVRSFSIFAWFKWKSIASTNATKPIITLFNPRAKNYVSLYFGENMYIFNFNYTHSQEYIRNFVT